jgi:hypothetical protein
MCSMLEIHPPGIRAGRFFRTNDDLSGRTVRLRVYRLQKVNGGSRGPSIDWGIMKGAIRPVGYIAGWGLVDGMDATYGWDRG